MTTITSLTPSQLRQAAKIKEKIEALEADLSRILGSSVTGSGKRDGRRRPMSAAAKALIAAAQRRRWAAYHAKKKATAK